MPTPLVPLLFAALLISCLLTFVLRSYARRRNLLDVPNSRSSHRVPTPRGGGLAIAITFLSGLMFLAQAGLLESSQTIAIGAGGAALALLGLVDDMYSLSFKIRLVFQTLSASASVYLLGPIIPRDLGLAVPVPTWICWIVTVGGLVWLTNLTNFMDGIDGLAASEAVFFSAVFGLFLYLSGVSGLASASFLLGSASAGFLFWNWPPAKIFMGDVGSGFLGFTFGTLALAGAHRQGGSLWVPLILLALFITDATITLLRRLFAGQQWYAAHRTHAYQHGARKWGHLRVTLAACLLNLLWLVPCAAMARIYLQQSGTWFLLASAPLLTIGLALGAGREDSIPSPQSPAKWHTAAR